MCHGGIDRPCDFFPMRNGRYQVTSVRPLLRLIDVPGIPPRVHRGRREICDKFACDILPVWENAAVQLTPFVGDIGMEDWEKRLDDLLQGQERLREEQAKGSEQLRDATEENRRRAIEFISSKALPAFRELEKGFQKRGFVAHSERDMVTGASILLTINGQGEGAADPRPFQYAIYAYYNAPGVRIEAVTSYGRHNLRKANRVLSVDEIGKNDVIDDFMTAYEGTFPQKL